MKNRVSIWVLAITLCVTSVVPAWATTISDIKKEKDAVQKELNSIQSDITEIEGNKEAVAEEIEELDSRLVELLSTVEVLKQDIKNKEAEIDKAQDAYEEAKADEETQYEAMKLRIRFMYEKGETSYLELFLKAESISDMVNKVDYVEKLYEYDRALLLKYQEAKEKVLVLKESLETEKAEMVELEVDLEAEENSLQTLISEKQETVENFNKQLISARSQAKVYSATIKAKTAEIKRIEAEEAARKKAAEEARKKAEEEAKRASAQKSGSSSSSSGSSTGSSPSPSVSETISNSGGSEKGKEIANFACQYVGNPYVPGGTSLTDGADCSGFTYAVMKNFGISIPRNSSAQAVGGSGVDYANAQPGDIICYAGHVGLYIGGGRIVHASTQATGIKISNATYRSILAVRRYY